MEEPTSCCRATGGYCDRCDLLVDLPGLHVIGVEHDTAGRVVVTVESSPGPIGCPACAVVATGHGRDVVTLVDAPCFGRPVRIRWRKRRWRCLEPSCSRTVFVEKDDRVAAPRAKLTTRACWWAITQIRREHASINGIRRLREVLPLLGEPVGDDGELDGVFTDYLRAYESAWQPYPDVDECLETLRQRGHRLAVLSNGSDEQQRKKLTQIAVVDYFPDVFTAETLGVGKPNREAYDRTAQALRVPVSECLMVGDDYDLDVLAPRGAGWQALHLDRTRQRREAGALTTLTQLPALLI